ncbi:helix-turn-helix domain-containing protein [Rhodococcus sp. IEGM 1304]|uniref:sigma-54-dependent Fis family transcriptional regulator n=1 Tax=Rhodococcus sp. IEGM 1304 TaxID=3082227 RepID=UPI00295550ED|nr:helix-turn-helix domain-containing protein [Rhodococcus sp. IEGM 1304]MDV8129211.1 helix-turn-helix domain-containing protein [Rhodococcus sp. IEGM 1304]
MYRSSQSRPEIALSWKRSAMCGLEPTSLPSTSRIPVDAAANNVLLRASEPVLSEVAQQIQGTDTAVLLADRDCTVVTTVSDAAPIKAALEQAGIGAGTYLGEDVLGTNAVGTAAELRHGIFVHGDEHFLDAVKGFSCYAHPIVHPATQRVEGILGFTGFADAASPLFGAFVQRVVQAIEQRILDSSYESEGRLVTAFQSATRRLGGAVCAFGDDFNLSNDAAQNLLEITDSAELRRLATDARPDEPLHTKLTIDHHREIAVTVTKIPAAGAVVGLEPLWVQSNPVPRRSPSMSSSGYVWGPRLKALREAHGSVSLTGEAGTGRTVGARELAKPHPCAMLDAADLSVEGQGRWSMELIELSETHEGVLIIENVELLPPQQRTLLARVLADPHPIPRIVVTSLTGPDSAELEPLLARCAHRAELSPLRERIGDFPALIAALTFELTGHNRFNFTASALKALSTQPWPGNLTELRTVLARALHGRTGGAITAADLPPSHSESVHRALLGRDRAERQAIVEALRASCGNKVHAAESLGISRATLYRRMRTLNVS